MANVEELREWIAKNDWLVTDGWILVGLNSESDDAPWFTYSTITDGTEDLTRPTAHVERLAPLGYAGASASSPLYQPSLEEVRPVPTDAVAESVLPAAGKRLP